MSRLIYVFPEKILRVVYPEKILHCVSRKAKTFFTANLMCTKWLTYSNLPPFTKQSQFMHPFLRRNYLSNCIKSICREEKWTWMAFKSSHPKGWKYVPSFVSPFSISNGDIKKFFFNRNFVNSLKHFMRDLKKKLMLEAEWLYFSEFWRKDVTEEFSNYLDKLVKAVCVLAVSQEVGLLHFQHQKRFLKVIVSSY